MAFVEALLPAALIAAYLRRVATLRKLGREPSGVRQACFVTGMLLLAITQIGPLAELSRDLVSAHMVTHTLATDEASLLIALGLTGPVLGPLVATPVIRQVVRLFSPIGALIAWILAISIWHLPSLYEAAADNPALHFLQHACFIGAGLALWLTVFGPFPQPKWFNGAARVGLVVVVHLFNTVLANAFLFSGETFYEGYAERALAEHGMDPASDQGIAGGILMAQGFVVMLGVLTYEILRWAREESESQELVDLAREAGVELDEERAQRAARAGNAEVLRKRIEAAAREEGRS
ncbi:MAG TPA: cytochrome c oxidase assembly protein [Solirubrobacterales bacterium]